jgi:hypothetical protein
MNLLCILKDVFLFEETSTTLFLSRKNKLTILYKDLLRCKELYLNIFYMLKFGKFILVQQEESNKTIIIDGGLREIDESILIKNYIDKTNIYILSTNNSTTKFDSEINLCNTFKIGRFPRLIYNNKFLRTPNSKLECYYLDNVILIWQKDINQLLDSNDVTQTGEIIPYKDKIFIYLYDNEDKRATIALDVETGNELFRTSEFMGYIRLQEDKIYALYEKSVSILDPETYQIRKIDLSEELAVLDKRCEEYFDLGESLDYTIRRFNFSPTIYEVHYPYLYFAQERGAQVGIVNLETEKLEWHALMDIDYPINPVVMDIRACENRLYVHCADKTLHVFEKE